jgi:hypothetical protein
MYASLLALISVSAKPRWSKLVTRHLAFLLVVIFGVYFYRDLWPLATYTTTPVDICEGRILWAKGIVLTLIAVAIPLLIPRQYVPVDAKVHPLTDSVEFVPYSLSTYRIRCQTPIRNRRRLCFLSCSTPSWIRSF